MDLRRLAVSMLLLACAAGCSQKPPTPPTFAASDLPSAASLRSKIDEIVAYTRTNRHLDAGKDSAWQVVHGVLAYGGDFNIYHDGKLVSALSYLLDGGSLNGWRLQAGDDCHIDGPGKPPRAGLRAILEPGTKTGQGHPDQWLGYLSQCGLKPDDSLVVAGRTYTVRNLITQAQWDVHAGMEATWTLMAFGEYLPFDASWTAKDGATWNVERLVALEAAHEIKGAACGGCHRLYALSAALNRYLDEYQKPGAPLEGGWKAAEDRIQAAIETARQYQQPDGTFSTSFFERPGTSNDLDAQIASTGHILEFLTLAMKDQQFQEPWVTKAAVRLCSLLDQTRDVTLNCGSLYHAAHALQLYRLRQFGPPVGEAVPGTQTAAK